MTETPLTLVCFAVKEEAAPFKAALAPHSDIQILLTGMGQLNAEKSIRSALHNSHSSHHSHSLPSAASDQSTNPSLHHSTTPSLVLTCGFAGALNPDLSLGSVLFSCDDAPHLQPRLLAAGARPARFHCANRVASTAAEKRQLWESTHADAVEMESQIISNICREHKIPCATVRVVLDTASEDLPLDFNFLMTADQQMDYRKLAFSLAKSPSKIAALLRLQKQSKAAASKLASVLLKII
jgi:adenosylhomocysteine nucleosidase